MTSERVRTARLAALVLVLLVAGAAAARSNSYYQATDFFCLYQGARSLVVGHDPYDEAWWREVAGAALSALALKPQVVALAIPAIALRALVQRRWRLLSVAVGTGALMVVVPMLFLPGWVSEWLDELVVRRARVAVFLPTAWGFAADVFGSPIIGGLLVAAVAIGCWLLVRGSSPDDVGLFALTLPLSLFATPYAWSYDFLVLFVSYAFVLARAGGASPRARMWLTIGAVALAGPVQWLLYTVAFPRGNETLSAVVTAATALLVAAALRARSSRAGITA